MRLFGMVSLRPHGQIHFMTCKALESDNAGKAEGASRNINLILPMPPSANVYWRTTARNGFAHTYVSDEAKAYKASVARLVGIATPVYSAIALSVKVFRPQRSGDLDNRLKVLIDALKGVVYADDKQIDEIHAFRYEDKFRPRVEVEILVKGLC